jgi:sulfate adenylyltransferase (ADP) / ATP adenylyltransferase
VTDNAGIATQGNKGKAFDPFAPPYNINLHVGDLKDDEAQEEFVVLVSEVFAHKPFRKYFTKIF